MQRVCTKCNTLVTGDGAFCPSCGEPLPTAVQLDKNPSGSVQFTAPQPGNIPSSGTSQMNGGIPNYGAPQPAPVQGYGTSNAQFNNNIQQMNEPEMTIGQWVGTIILTSWFGVISLIIAIVWGCSSTSPTAKKRFCQAMIIVQIITLVLSFISMIVFFAGFASFAAELADSWGDISTYYYR